MKRALLVLVVLLSAGLLGSYSVGESPSGGSSGWDQCRHGSLRGGGYDQDTGLYAWTCANYPWSAYYGGVDGSGYSDYDTATTAGGNSWDMTCTGDGQASGDQPEEVACLYAGETIHMYVMADWMLAHDNTKPGGSIYVPAGIYLDRGCGRSASAVANGCPVLQNDTTHYQRRIQAYGGRRFIGEGRDDTSPLFDERSGTYLVFDHGNDADACDDNYGGGAGSNNCGRDPADGAEFGSVHSGDRPQWAFRVGLDPSADTYCAMDSGDTDCVALSTEHLVGVSPYGRNSTIEATITHNAIAHDACIANTLASHGVCSGDPRVRCTVDDGTRTSAVAGGCSALSLGSCVGVATQAENERAAGTHIISFTATMANQDGYGDPTDVGEGTQTPAGWTRITTSSGTCDGGDGLYLGFEIPDASTVSAWPFPLSSWDATAQGARIVRFTDDETWMNDKGGFYHMSIMPANWIGRDSSNDAADCSATGDPTCDEAEALALGAGVGGGFYDVAVHLAGGGDEYSTIDGTPMGFDMEVRDSLFMRGGGLIGDISGWRVVNNRFIDWDCGTGKSCFSLGYSPSSIFSDNYGKRLRGVKFLSSNGSTIVTNLLLESSSFTRGIVELRSNTHDGVFSNVVSIGGKGPLIGIAPDDGTLDGGLGVSNLVFRDWIVRAHNLRSASGSAPWAMIYTSDFDGAYGANGWAQNILFDNIQAESSTPDVCIIFLGGGTGDDSDAQDGLGRNVDDWRHELTFKHIGLERGVESGVAYAFCLGNQHADENEADERLGDIWDASGPIPRWEGVYLNGVQFPDHNIQSMAASDVPDCGDMVYGITVEIYDDTAAQACTDAGADGQLDGGGTARSACFCDPSGDSGDGVWYPWPQIDS
jgi:hypothetical protein